MLYYSSKSYSNQIKTADFYRELQPVIFIGILDFEQTENKKYISRSQVRDVETGERTIKDIEFTFIVLPKFKLELHELKTLTEKWVYLIKNAENLEIVPENINDEGLKSAYEKAYVMTWAQEELDAYEYTFIREKDARARLDNTEQKRKTKKEIEAVIGLHHNGISIAIIAKSLNISEDRVRQKIVELFLQSFYHLAVELVIFVPILMGVIYR